MKELFFAACVMLSLKSYSYELKDESGAKDIEECSVSEEDISVCTAKVLNKKLNSIEDTLKGSGVNFKLCKITYCALRGAAVSNYDSLNHMGNCQTGTHPWRYATYTLTATGKGQAFEKFLKSDVRILNTRVSLNESVTSIECEENK